MITSAFIPGTEDLEETFAIRREVFVEEQGIGEDEEFDEFDTQALHLIVYVDEQPAATGRICVITSYSIHYTKLYEVKSPP